MEITKLKQINSEVYIRRGGAKGVVFAGLAIIVEQECRWQLYT